MSAGAVAGMIIGLVTFNVPGVMPGWPSYRYDSLGVRFCHSLRNKANACKRI